MRTVVLLMDAILFTSHFTFPPKILMGAVFRGRTGKITRETSIPPCTAAQACRLAMDEKKAGRGISSSGEVVTYRYLQ